MKSHTAHARTSTRLTPPCHTPPSAPQCSEPPHFLFLPARGGLPTVRRGCCGCCSCCLASLSGASCFTPAAGAAGAAGSSAAGWSGDGGPSCAAGPSAGSLRPAPTPSAAAAAAVVGEGGLARPSSPFACSCREVSGLFLGVSGESVWGGKGWGMGGGLVGGCAAEWQHALSQSCSRQHDCFLLCLVSVRVRTQRACCTMPG